MPARESVPSLNFAVMGEGEDMREGEREGEREGGGDGGKRSRERERVSERQTDGHSRTGGQTLKQSDKQTHKKGTDTASIFVYFTTNRYSCVFLLHINTIPRHVTKVPSRLQFNLVRSGSSLVEYGQFSWRHWTQSFTLPVVENWTDVDTRPLLVSCPLRPYLAQWEHAAWLCRSAFVCLQLWICLLMSVWVCLSSHGITPVS